MTGARPRKPAESRGGFLMIQVKVKPRSSMSQLLRDASGTWVARLKSAPVDGKANAELIALVAQWFDRPKTAVSITSGATARLKLLRIEGVTSADGGR